MMPRAGDAQTLVELQAPEAEIARLELGQFGEGGSLSAAGQHPRRDEANHHRARRLIQTIIPLPPPSGIPASAPAFSPSVS